MRIEVSLPPLSRMQRPGKPLSAKAILLRCSAGPYLIVQSQLLPCCPVCRRRLVVLEERDRERCLGSSLEPGLLDMDQDFIAGGVANIRWRDRTAEGNNTKIFN